MKSIAVDESLSSMNQQFCSRENQLLQINRIVQISPKKSRANFANQVTHVRGIIERQSYIMVCLA